MVSTQLNDTTHREQGPRDAKGQLLAGWVICPVCGEDALSVRTFSFDGVVYLCERCFANAKAARYPTDRQLANPPEEIRLRDRLQLLVGTVEIAATRLDGQAALHKSYARYRAAAVLDEVAGHLRAAVAEATAKPAPVEPRDYSVQPERADWEDRG